MTTLYNHSKEKTEKGYKETCPRCRGFGATLMDKDHKCTLCLGYGKLWISDSGWTRPLFGRITKSEKLY